MPSSPARRAPTVAPVPEGGLGARQFTQRRSRATYQALLEASAQVFAEKGFDAAQTPDIARAAGVSVGSFYRYFTDKRQAFVEMIRAHLDGVFQGVMAQLTLENFHEPATPAARRAGVERVLELMFAHAAHYPALHRVFIGMSLRDDEVQRIRVEFEERGRDVLATLIRQQVPSARIADPVAAAEVIQIAAQEVAVAAAGARGTSPKSRAAARARRSALTEMITRYVFGDD